MSDTGLELHSDEYKTVTVWKGVTRDGETLSAGFSIEGVWTVATRSDPSVRRPMGEITTVATNRFGRPTIEVEI